MKLSISSLAIVLGATVAFGIFPAVPRPLVHSSSAGALAGCAPGTGNVVHAKDCGATGDGATSDRDALQRCVSAAAGGVCLLGSGTFVVDSARDKPIGIPNDVTLKGAGPETTRIVLTGTVQVNQLLTFENPSNDWVEDLTLEGNSVNSCAGCGGLIAFVGTEKARAAMTHFGLRNVRVENDRHDYWVYVFNGSNMPMREIAIDRLRAGSREDNCRDLGNIGVPCDVISFQGQYYHLGGIVDGVTITAPDADGDHIKRFADFWEGVSNVRLTGGNLRNFGAHAGTDAGAYAIIAYFKDPLKVGASRPSHIWITGNTITNPRTNGVYLASARDIHIDGNTISGQSDPADGTIPHGAISFNGSSGEASGNVLTDNIYGIEAIPNRATGPDVVLSRNTIKSSVPHGKGIAVLGNPTPGDVALTDNTIAEAGEGSFGVVLNGSTKAPLGRVAIRGGTVSASYTDVYIFDSAGGVPGAAAIEIEGGVYAGSPTNSALIAANCGAIPIAIQGAVFDGANYRDGDGVSLRGCTNTRLDGLTLKNMTGGKGRMLRLDGANVRTTGTQYVNVAPENR